jgi:hypothetical protein
VSSSSSIIDLKQLYPPLGKYLPDLPDLPSAPQAIFLLLDNRDAFYGGAAGGGKSAALLMGGLQYVDRPGYHALILRRTFPELEGADGLIAQSHEWLEHSDAKWNEQKHRWTFPSGATIQFGHCEEENDKYRYQGQAYQYVGFDELTHFTEAQYDYITRTRARRSLVQREQGIPIRARGASNPGNVGHAWVASRFIEQRKPGVVFIPAKAADNPGLDVAEYWEGMKDLPETLRRQLWDGDWSVTEGAAFRLAPEHLIEPFPKERAMPDWWERFESMDYGLTNPTAWHFWAIDGEGNLICFWTHYKPGLPSETAPAILNLRGHFNSRLCWGDPQSLAAPTTNRTRLGAPATIQTEFAEQGLWLGKANNNPRAGYTRLCEFLRLDPEHRFPDWHPRRGEKGAPRLFIVERHCPDLVKQLRIALLQPLDMRHGGEMVDPKWESAHGHAVAAARYGVLTRFPASEEPEREPEDPRAALIYRHEKREEEQQRTIPYQVV